MFSLHLAGHSDIDEDNVVSSLGLTVRICFCGGLKEVCSECTELRFSLQFQRDVCRAFDNLCGIIWASSSQFRSIECAGMACLGLVVVIAFFVRMGLLLCI